MSAIIPESKALFECPGTEDGPAGDKTDQDDSEIHGAGRSYKVTSPRRGNLVLKFEKGVVVSAQFVETKTEGSPEPSGRKD